MHISRVLSSHKKIIIITQNTHTHILCVFYFCCPRGPRAHFDTSSCPGTQRARGLRQRQTDRRAEAQRKQGARQSESELQTASPPLSITIIIASASALAHCHHVNTLHCTLLTGPQRLPCKHIALTHTYRDPDRTRQTDTYTHTHVQTKRDTEQTAYNFASPLV